MGGVMITRNPGIFGGKPIIQGTRISVETISDYLALGYGVRKIQRDFPHLSEEQIHAALRFLRDKATREMRKLEP